VLGFAPLGRLLNARLRGTLRIHVTYQDGQGVMHRLLQVCDRRHWQLSELSSDAPAAPADAPRGQVGVMMTLTGAGILNAAAVLADVAGVSSIRQLDDEAE
jgi:putative Mg2+ transporter-C (MgtC) family protein